MSHATLMAAAAAVCLLLGGVHGGNGGSASSGSGGASAASGGGSWSDASASGSGSGSSSGDSGGGVHCGAGEYSQPNPNYSPGSPAGESNEPGYCVPCPRGCITAHSDAYGNAICDTCAPNFALQGAACLSTLLCAWRLNVRGPYLDGACSLDNNIPDTPCRCVRARACGGGSFS